MQHMREELLKREQMPHQPCERQGFDDVLLMEHLHTMQLGIQLQDDVMADSMSRNIVAFEIEADHAVPIHGCRSRCSPSSDRSQLSGSTKGGRGGNVGRWAKAVSGGRLPHERAWFGRSMWECCTKDSVTVLACSRVRG
jgi:hypothetical protein